MNAHTELPLFLLRRQGIIHRVTPMDVPLSAVQKLRVDHETPASLLLQWRAPADTIVTRFRVSVCAALDVCVAGGWILDPSCSPNCLCDGAGEWLLIINSIVLYRYCSLQLSGMCV